MVAYRQTETKTVKVNGLAFALGLPSGSSPDHGPIAIRRAIDQKLHDIAASGPVELRPDYSKLKIVGLTRQIVESYAPVNIKVSYAGQDGTARPFLIIIEWIKVGMRWQVASEIILPVPPTPNGSSIK